MISNFYPHNRDSRDTFILFCLFECLSIRSRPPDFKKLKIFFPQADLSSWVNKKNIIDFQHFFMRFFSPGVFQHQNDFSDAVKSVLRKLEYP